MPSARRVPAESDDDDSEGDQRPPVAAAAAADAASTTITATGLHTALAFNFNTADTPQHTPADSSPTHHHRSFPSPHAPPTPPPAVTVSRVYADVNTVLYPPSHSDYASYQPAYNAPDAYQLLRRLGRGKYSEVFLALHTAQRRQVVVKVLKPVRRLKVRRECHVLRAMGGCEGSVRLLDVVRDPVSKYVSLVFEHVEAMGEWKERFLSLTPPQCAYILHQLLATLRHAHSHGIMHRDVKPHNLLIHPTTLRATLIDWGLADYYHPATPYNVRVCSRYFKAPELLLGHAYYDYGVDLWSVGCVMAGMLYGRHPFFHGRDNADQLVRIAAVTGTDELYRYTTKHHIAVPDDIQRRLNASRHLQPAHRGWETLGATAAAGRALRSGVALDLLSRLLAIDHQQRLTVDEALAHPYFAHLQGKPAPPPAQPSDSAPSDVDAMEDVEDEDGSDSDSQRQQQQQGDDSSVVSALEDSDAHSDGDAGGAVQAATREFSSVALR